MPAKTKKNTADTSEPLEDIQPITKNAKSSKQNDKKKKKRRFPVVPVLILLLIIGSIVAILAFNVFNIRDEYIMPYLRNAPLIGNLLPTPEPEVEAEGEYAGMTQEELIALITSLEYQIDNLETSLNAVTDTNEQNEETIRVLRGYEALLEEYRQIKARFDEMIVNGDPKAYAEFFESVSPENAERLYKDAVGQIQYNSEEKKNAAIFANMDTTVAAAALEKMLASDAALVVRIFKILDAVHAAAILDEMEPANVAVIQRLLAPTEVPVSAAQTAPPLPTPVPVQTAEPGTVTDESGETEQPTTPEPEDVVP